MADEHTKAELQDIPVEQIEPNPENPRLLFRSGELEELVESIRRYGVQVPITVYRSGNKYVLLDGERRWRCCLKLNRKTIPALIQERPGVLDNLLLMFNIHALREQWDLMTIALKLPRVIDLLIERDGKKPNENQIAEYTGLKRGVVRRCKLLIDLPRFYQDQILEELQKPKARQKLTEDFFIEMERALTTIERAMPKVIPDRNRARRVLIRKFKTGVIKNRTDFRMLSKIASAERVHSDAQRAGSVLRSVFAHNRFSIDEAFQQSVSGAYSERDLLTRIRGLLERLRALRSKDLDAPLRSALEELRRKLSRLLGSER